MFLLKLDQHLPLPGLFICSLGPSSLRNNTPFWFLLLLSTYNRRLREFRAGHQYCIDLLSFFLQISTLHSFIHPRKFTHSFDENHETTFFDISKERDWDEITPEKPDTFRYLLHLDNSTPCDLTPSPTWPFWPRLCS